MGPVIVLVVRDDNWAEAEVWEFSGEQAMLRWLGRQQCPGYPPSGMGLEYLILMKGYLVPLVWISDDNHSYVLSNYLWGRG